MKYFLLALLAMILSIAIMWFIMQQQSLETEKRCILGAEAVCISICGDPNLTEQEKANGRKWYVDGQSSN